MFLKIYKDLLYNKLNTVMLVIDKTILNNSDNELKAHKSIENQIFKICEDFKYESKNMLLKGFDLAT